MKPWRLLGAALLMAIAAGLSGVLLLEHYGALAPGGVTAQLCGGTAGAPSGCETVGQSAYAAVGPVPLAAAGLLFYLSIAYLCVLATVAGEGDERAGAGFVAFGALVLAAVADLILLGVQAFAIDAYCRLCIATYVLGAGALLALLPVRGRALAVRALACTRIGRIVAASWIFGVVAMAMATAAGSVAASTAESAAEAQRLQEILDDPRKLEEYRSDRLFRQLAEAPPVALAQERVAVRGAQGDAGGGAAGGPLLLSMFSDFLCPHCQRMAITVEALRERSGGRLAIAYRHFPLELSCNPGFGQTLHPGACLLAMAGICAEGQGRFWELHDLVLRDPPRNPSKDDVLRIARQAGLDAEAMAACLDAPDTAAILKRDIEEGERAGVRGTPALFLNGKKIPRNEMLVAIVRHALRESAAAAVGSGGTAGTNAAPVAPDRGSGEAGAAPDGQDRR
ncbi:MAG: DsbA family protein [Candidatus Schekmanbacteria bacterium]|nr:DsbA family protein [Candidatus Schekmanbacteria bacterium]